MKEFLSVNMRTIARVVAAIAGYAIIRWFPGHIPERELLIAVTEILGLGILGLMPGLRAPRRSDDEQAPP